MNAKTPPIRIKKYANRRLYNTRESRYITLDDLAELVKRDEEFVVIDAKSGKDITRSVLTQIIVDEESKGDDNLLPLNFLRQLIRLYGNNIKAVFPSYLDHSIQNFVSKQEKIQDYVAENMENVGSQVNSMLSPLPVAQKFNESMEGLAKQNVAMFEQAMNMFAPFITQTTDKEISRLEAQKEYIDKRLKELKKTS